MSVRQTPKAGMRYYIDGRRVSRDSFMRTEHAYFKRHPDRSPHNSEPDPGCPLCKSVEKARLA